MDDDPLDEITLPLLFPDSQVTESWEKEEEHEWDPEPNGQQQNDEPEYQDFSSTG